MTASREGCTVSVPLYSINPLIEALLDCEFRLSAWVNESDLNADLFRRDPLAAITAANLSITGNLLRDLEETMTGIALKLKAR
jgi:hypothetical protein